MELCLAYARERRRLSVDRVADLMGLPSRWSIYKWLENGRLPATLIPPFEHACGVDFVTQYLAHSKHKLLVDIPTGRQATEMELHELQGAFGEALGLLIKVYHGAVEPDQASAALNRLMGGLAWHRENIAKSQTPELALFDGEVDDNQE